MSTLTIHEYGDGAAPTVVLVHGVTDAGHNWPDLVTRWRDEYHLLALDLRGHGTSPRFTPDELARAIDVMLDDLLTVLDEQPEPVVLVGHSLGGILSLRAALRRPDRVRALVLEDPAKPSGDRGPDTQFVAQTEAFLDALLDDPAGQVERAARDTSWSRTELTAWAVAKAQVDRSYIHGGLVLGDAAWEELFDALTVPTLLVVPPDAPMAPELTLVHNPLLRAQVIAGAGHCVRRDQPGAYFAAVEGFLADVAAR